MCSHIQHVIVAQDSHLKLTMFLFSVSVRKLAVAINKFTWTSHVSRISLHCHLHTHKHT